MKVAAGQIAGVLRDLSRFTGVVLHGDDSGLVRERALAVARAVVASLDDPFLSSVLVKEEHNRLTEEARSQSLLGGRRVVRVLDAGDGLAPLASRLEPEGALVVLESKALDTRSRLRKMAEAAPAWACIACYSEEGPALAASIRRDASLAGYELTDDAVALLTRELAVDTATRRAELEKLFLFAGGEKQVGLEMAVQCCARVAEASMDLLLASLMEGDVGTVGRLLQYVVDEGATGPGMIVSLTTRIQRVLKVRLRVEAGGSVEEAVRSLTPPVFGRDAVRLGREAQSWPEPALLGLLADARAADIACKRAASRDATIACQLFLVAARRAARQKRAS